ncbi:hypothetical protein FB570_11993 [Streptomyces sp. T12]|uniref:hypothetical protein n=1 Tax=Streptomyces sp. T12 TaxID=477697 RepID=UPI00119E687D|nr:hypothetical protein [Streptomyces sp. T12]TWD13166.1 hypothetical protein FB570_11993 [Streptomyces sp. T12]
MKKSWSALISGSLMAISVLGFQSTATAASAGPVTVTAHPSGCSYQTLVLDGHRGASAQCTKSNGGHYKAIVVCRRVLNGDKVSREAAAWKSSGLSTVWCPPETIEETAGIMTKAS